MQGTNLCDQPLFVFSPQPPKHEKAPRERLESLEARSLIFDGSIFSSRLQPEDELRSTTNAI